MYGYRIAIFDSVIGFDGSHDYDNEFKMANPIKMGIPMRTMASTAETIK